MIQKNQVENYQTSSGKHLQNVKAAFENLNLKEAIEKAAKSIDLTNENKMFTHQRRVGYEIAKKGYEELKDREQELKQCKSFQEILLITDEVSKIIYRLGSLWSYDTALRIGFNLKIYPEYIYLQAGVKKGYKKLFKQNSKERFVSKLIFPIEVHSLEPYEIENFLCIWGCGKTIC